MVASHPLQIQHRGGMAAIVVEVVEATMVVVVVAAVAMEVVGIFLALLSIKIITTPEARPNQGVRSARTLGMKRQTAGTDMMMIKTMVRLQQPMDWIQIGMLTVAHLTTSPQP
jgi:hypothetical protein